VLSSLLKAEKRQSHPETLGQIHW